MREPHSEQWIADGVESASTSVDAAAPAPRAEAASLAGGDNGGLLERASRNVADVVGRLARSISATMAAKPNTTRFCIAAIFVMVIAFALKQPSHAQGVGLGDPFNDEVAINPGVEGQIDTAYDITAHFSVLQNALGVAQVIFISLAATSLAYSLVAYYIRNQSVRGLGQRFLTMLLSLGIPFVIILSAPTVLPTLTYAGLQIADNITGNPNSIASYTGDPRPDYIEATLSNIYNATFGTVMGPGQTAQTISITPKTIIDEGVKLAWPLLRQVHQDEVANQGNTTGSKGAGNNEANFQEHQMETSFILTLAIAIIGTFVFISVELVIAFMQIYLVIPVSAFTLGFLGAPATSSFGNGYWRVVLQALLKFTIIVFVIGFAISMAEQYRVQLTDANQAYQAHQAMQPPTPNTNNTTDDGVMKLAISTAALSVSLLYVVRALPGLFGAVFSGADIGASGVQAEFEGAAMGGRGGAGVPFSRTLGSRGAPMSQAGKNIMAGGPSNPRRPMG